MDYPTIVDQAVREFYTAGNNEAHSWLLQVQASPEAWQFVWQLLDPSKSGEVQFFAATTLHVKISKQWDEVPKDEYSVLRECLLKSIRQPNIPKFVLLKLCQALAAFMVNSYNAENREKDTSIADDIFATLPLVDNPYVLGSLLRVLSLIPTECERRREVTRVNLGEALISSWRKTLVILRQIFSTFNPESKHKNSILYVLGLECALAWFKIDKLPLEAIGQLFPDLLTASNHLATNKYKNDNELETARIEYDAEDNNWETVQECLIILVTHRDLNKWPQTLWSWARYIIKMAKYNWELLAAIGETHSREFLIALAGGTDNPMHTQTAKDLVKELLACSACPGYYPTTETRSNIPFGFWYALQDDLATIDQPLDGEALTVLKPIYLQLAKTLLSKSALPLDSRYMGDANERELFRCYRQDVADTLNYCYKVLNEELLLLIGQRLSWSLEHPESRWTDVEATLHAFKALAESIGTRNDRFVPELINIILSHVSYKSFPDEVLACACSALGAYAEWIGVHPECWLERVLQYITLGLTQGPAIAPFASMALKDVVRECGEHIAPYSPFILNTIRQTLPNVAPGGGEALRLMYAAGKVLNTLPTMEQQLAYLDATLGLCIVKIKELLEQPLFVARVSVTNQLKMVTMFFSTLEGAIGKAVLEGLLPLFNQIIAHPEWSQDNATLEAMHMCAQRSLTALLHPETDARPLLPILTTSYKTWPHPAALNLLRQLVLLFRRDPDNIIGPVLAEISSITLSGVKACKSVQGDLSDWSDLMEAYLGVLTQICKKNTRLLLQIPDQIPEMLQCGIACLTLPETATAKAASNFLNHAIMQSLHLQTFIQPIGQELVSVILHCISEGVPHNNLEPQAEVMLALNKTCPEWAMQWLQVAFENQKGPIKMLPKESLRRILRERTKGRLCEVLKELSVQCRQKTGLVNFRDNRNSNVQMPNEF